MTRMSRWPGPLFGPLGAALMLGACAGDPDVAGTTEGSTGPEVGGEAPEPLEPPPCSEPAPGPRRIRRLSHVEYGNTIRALVALPPDVVPESSLSLDDVVDGFENDADALIVTPVLASQYRVAAESFAEVVVDGLDDTLPCATVPNLDAAASRACATTFIESFGSRAFRRPLETVEVDDYLALWSDVAKEDGLAEGIHWTTAAILQSPSFLYRSELGVWDDAREAYVLTPYEVATQLSYLITAGPPDETLIAAAEAGEFAGPDGPQALLDHADRLLASDHGGRAYADFVESWLGVRRTRVSPDPDVYFNFTEQIRDDMRGQLRHDMASALRDGATVSEIFESTETHVTPDLAMYYGMPPVLPELGDDDGYVRTTLPPERAGILAQGRVLTVYADPAASAPVQRGKMVRERILCESLPPPPPGVDANPIAPNEDQTTRERHAAHTDNPACFNCHKYMDPIGFGFEHFDGIARWRDTENGKPIDATGEFVPGPREVEGAFDGLDEMQGILADHPGVGDCYARQWMQFASAAPDEDAACLRDDLTRALHDSDGRLDAPLRALLESRWFFERL